MSKPNLLQVFSAMSPNIGVDTPESLACTISENQISNYLPLSNTGRHADVLRQEDAAKKYGLKPRYGRVFTFLNPSNTHSLPTLTACPITIYAKTKEGRDWLYQLPAELPDIDRAMNMLLAVPKGGAMLFLEPTWLLLAQEEVRQLVKAFNADIYLSINTLTHGYNGLTFPGWECVYYRPICAATEDKVMALSHVEKLRKSQNSPFTLLPEGDVEGSSCTREMTCHIEDRFKGLILTSADDTSLPDNAVMMETLFAECEEMPSIRSVFEQHQKERESLSVKTVLNSLGGLSVNDHLSLQLLNLLAKKADNKNVDTYNSRLDAELAMVEEYGHTAFVLDAIMLSKASSTLTDPIYLRGRAGHSLILHVLGLTAIDPVAENLEPELIYRWTERPMLHFDIVRESDQDALNSELGRVTGQFVHPSVRTHQHALIRSLRATIKKTSYRDVFEEKIKELDGRGRLPEVRFSDEVELFKQWIKTLPYPEPREVLAAYEANVVNHIRGAGHAFHVMPIPSYEVSPVGDDGSVGLTSEELEDLGLMSFQLLGLRSLGTLRKTLQEKQLPFGTLEDVPLRDETGKTEALYREGKTKGVFQSDSPGVMEYLSAMEWDGVRAVSNILVLYRPGPLKSGMMNAYLRSEPLTYGHDIVDAILAPTRGVMIYQNQLVQLLKRALGFSPEEVLATYQQINSNDGMDLFRITREITDIDGANIIASLCERDGRHLFCEAHALTYAAYSYKQAYLLAHYPVQSVNHIANYLFEHGFSGAQEKVKVMIELSEAHGVTFAGIDENTNFHRIQVVNVDGKLVPAKNVEPVPVPQMRKMIDRMKRQSSRYARWR